MYIGDQITYWMSSLTLYVTAVGVAWSLLDSPRNSQAELRLFQKHLLCLEYPHGFSDCGCYLKAWWCVRSANLLTSLPVHILLPPLLLIIILPLLPLLLLLLLRLLLLFLLFLLLLLLSTALQLLVQSFGLPNHFLPPSSILDKGLPSWHF